MGDARSRKELKTGLAILGSALCLVAGAGGLALWRKHATQAPSAPSNPAAPAQAPSSPLALTSAGVALPADPAWFLRGGLLGGGFVTAPAQAEWPLWMQAVIGGRAGITSQELEKTDLFRVPDAFLPRTMQVLTEQRVFTPRLLQQASSIPYAAQLKAWNVARKDYMKAWVAAQGLPGQDQPTCSRVLSHLVREKEFATVRTFLQSPGTLRLSDPDRASCLRMLDLEEGLVPPSLDTVRDSSRSGPERLHALMALKSVPASDLDGILATFRDVDLLDQAVHHACLKGWLQAGSPWVEEATRAGKGGQEASFWFLVKPGERRSDLLWMRTVEALKGEDRAAASTLASSLLEHHPESWYRGHAAFLAQAMEISEHPAPQAPRTPWDLTLFNVAPVKDKLVQPASAWPEALQPLVARNRFDLILAATDPTADADLFLKAAFYAGQQDLVARWIACERALTPERTALLYPTFLLPVIQRLIQEEGLAGIVDAPFVLAMIKNESLFQPTAASSADAFGMMQLLKPTFSRMTKPGADISDPETNLRAGLRYFKQILKTAKLEGTPDGVRYAYILAGYHAGEGRARTWRTATEPRLSERTSPLDTLQRIESIPIASTRQYLAHVLGDREVYAALLK